MLIPDVFYGGHAHLRSEGDCMGRLWLGAFVGFLVRLILEWMFPGGHLVGELIGGFVAGLFGGLVGLAAGMLTIIFGAFGAIESTISGLIGGLLAR